MKNTLSKIYNKLPKSVCKELSRDEFIDIAYNEIKGSHNAYSYLNAIYKMIASHIGCRLEDVKKLLKSKCHLLHEITDIELIMYSCADIDKSTLNKYINWIIVFMSEQGCILPTPKEYKEKRIKYDSEVGKQDIYY